MNVPSDVKASVPNQFRTVSMNVLWAKYGKIYGVFTILEGSALLV